eukprot:TRINITY_DN1851_c0_g1_i1.p1 TRINITY_DN1851_c0_g1~~TRINITY_DN1851_c0_g1_i1.p1  ORF type:complete len:435 (+),score=120.09 TRINITY_DN1851_c0_g1_i1:115-1419(+)
MVDKQKIKGMVYDKINVFKEQKFEPGNRRWEFYMTLLYMICMLALALGFFISSLLTVIQKATTVDVSAYSYSAIVALQEDSRYDSVTCPCSDTQIEYGNVAKMDWVPFAFCRPDVDLVSTYNNCKKIKTCRVADPFRFQLLAFFAYLCPVADTFAKNEVAIFNSRTVSSTNFMTKKSFVDELTFYEGVVEQNVKTQLYTPVEIARALSYVNRPLNPNFVTERSSDSALIYDTSYTAEACFCKSDYLCSITKTLTYGTFTVGCSNLETYMGLLTNQAVPILKGILDTKWIDQNLSPEENYSTIEVALTTGLVHKWRNDIAASHPKYYKQCAPKSCKTVESTRTPFADALTAALAVLGGAATGVKIVVGLVYTALKKIYKIPEVDEVVPAGTTEGGTTDKDEYKKSPPLHTGSSRDVQVAAIETNSGGPYPIPTSH